MAVRSKNGAFYYEFMERGHRYNGTCVGCTNKRDAERYEKEVRRSVEKYGQAEAMDRLFEIRRQEIAGNAGILLSEAFDLAMSKPRRKPMSDTQRKAKQNVFGNFVAFMKDKHPEIAEVAAVTKAHAEEYLYQIQNFGRYGGDTTKLSARTEKLYHSVCQEVFRLIADDAAISGNPFASIPKPVADQTPREAFTSEELKLIHERADAFTRPLFITAIFTGLREGDICTLRREDVDLLSGVITRRTRKTGAEVIIPIAKPLRELLEEQLTGEDATEYVFPEHAKMYQENRSGISYRIKKMLEDLGIKTTKAIDGRKRSVSVKDLHSCRHTFCYYAGVSGIPLNVVQGIVGHMTPEMTRHYMNHATLQDRQKGIDILSERIAHAGFISEQDEPARWELIELVKTANMDKVKKILKFSLSL